MMPSWQRSPDMNESFSFRSIDLSSACACMQVLGRVHIIQEVCIGVVFFISGLVLNTQELKRVGLGIVPFILCYKYQERRSIPEIHNNGVISSTNFA